MRLLKDESYGENVFGHRQMEQHLPASVYEAFCQQLEQGKPLPAELADVIANAMKDWAMEKGATHFTHWFQPMTGITAEKHDAFLTPKKEGALSEFRGKELVKGEPDASSFPSGGLRATFEARGYTAWDPTSFAFVRDKTLYVPTLFCSYDGSALDKKTPLLRSLEALDRETVRLLRLLGYDTRHVKAYAGAEQEYFLVDEGMFRQRLDLVVTGRTLFGNKPVKGQELDDHYFGAIPERVKAFMEEVDAELWKLGVPAKTEHKEVAPGQFELAPVYAAANLASDQNQIMMDVLQRCARHHGMVCLLHEKPFAGINGSGKHNNWSLATDEGENLLEPGDSPQDNLRFLTVLAAIIKGVDEYQDLLRISVATAGNDHRLGADEAPPAIVSIFLGEELSRVLQAIESGELYVEEERQQLQLGVHALPPIFRDTTDRNRTSPFAFTGNKFEFRMLGSSLNISCPNTILNTIVAEELSRFSAVLESVPAEDINDTLLDLVRRTIKDHKRILFAGNGYSEAWQQEAIERGLHNLRSTADALVHYTDPENMALFARHGVYQPHELLARQNILLENYGQVLSIEARTMTEMVRTSILPAVTAYEEKLADAVDKKERAGLPAAVQRQILETLCLLEASLLPVTERLERSLEQMPESEAEKARYGAQILLPDMEEMRRAADEMERWMPAELWPLPSYNDMLFRYAPGL